MSDARDANAWIRLDLNLFRVFEAVYTQCSLTQAADTLHLSQSAISHSLRRLREQLGDDLFVREGNGVRHTPAAQRVWPEIQQALALMRQATRRVEDFAPERDVKEIRLGIEDEGEILVLPQIIMQVRRCAPQAHVTCVRLERSMLSADLQAGRLDCAIDVAQSTPKEIRHVSLRHDEFIVVQRCATQPDKDAYLAAQHVTVSSRRTGRSVEGIQLSKFGIDRRVAVVCQRYESACRLVAQTDLLLTMPRVLGELVNQHWHNHLFPLPVALPHLDFHLYWHEHRDADPLNRWIRDIVTQCVRAL